MQKRDFQIPQNAQPWAQLGVTSVREATLPVGPDGDNAESSDMCAEHPNQVKDVFCLNCQMAICSQVSVFITTG